VVKPLLNFPDLTGWSVWGATSWRVIRQIWGQVDVNSQASSFKEGGKMEEKSNLEIYRDATPYIIRRETVRLSEFQCEWEERAMPPFISVFRSGDHIYSKLIYCIWSVVQTFVRLREWERKGPRQRTARNERTSATEARATSGVTSGGISLNNIHCSLFAGWCPLGRDERKRAGIRVGTRALLLRPLENTFHGLR